MNLRKDHYRILVLSYEIVRVSDDGQLVCGFGKLAVGGLLSSRWPATARAWCGRPASPPEFDCGVPGLSGMSGRVRKSGGRRQFGRVSWRQALCAGVPGALVPASVIPPGRRFKESRPQPAPLLEGLQVCVAAPWPFFVEISSHFRFVNANLAEGSRPLLAGSARRSLLRWRGPSEPAAPFKHATERNETYGQL